MVQERPNRERSPEQAIQERQYYLPYHYIPRRLDSRIVYAARVDWAGEYLKSIELVAALVAASGASRILDLGCGDGRLVNELSGRFPDRRFVGLDYSSRAIAIAALYREHTNAEFLNHGIDESGLAKGTFDLVTLIEVLEHIPDAELEGFVRAAVDMVRAGGILLVTVPHVNKPLQSKHYRHFTSSSLRRLLTQTTGLPDEAVNLKFVDRQPRGLGWLRARLATNRYFTIEPLFQAELRRQCVPSFVSEDRCGRIIAEVRCR